MVAGASYAIRSRFWLGVEFAAFYIGAPLVIALFLPPQWLFSALFVFSIAGLFLLWRTGGLGWQNLLRVRRIPWREIAGIAIVTLLSGIVILSLTRPEALFALLRTRPEFLLIIFRYYPPCPRS